VNYLLFGKGAARAEGASLVAHRFPIIICLSSLASRSSV